MLCAIVQGLIYPHYTKKRGQVQRILRQIVYLHYKDSIPNRAYFKVLPLDFLFLIGYN